MLLWLGWAVGQIQAMLDDGVDWFQKQSFETGRGVWYLGLNALGQQ